MKKKILFLIIILLVITGCDANYELNITDDNIKEEIILTIPNDLDKEKKDKFLSNIGINNVAIVGGYENPYFDKKMEKGISDEKYIFTYNYDHNHPITKSRVLTSCFESTKIENNSSYYMVMLQEKYKCSYDFDEINFTLKTNNKVSRHNSKDFDKNSGIYKWNISKEDFDKTNIRFIVLKNEYEGKIVNTSKSLLKDILLTFFLIFIVIGGTLFIKKTLKVIDKFEI